MFRSLTLFLAAGWALQGAPIWYTGLGADIYSVTPNGSPGVVALTIPAVSLAESNHTVALADLFNRLGKLSEDPNDFGYLTQFGEAFSSPAVDLRPAAPNSLSGGSYLPPSTVSTAAGSVPVAFHGLPNGGLWQLAINDGVPLTDQSWRLVFNSYDAAPAPEPGSTIPAAAGLVIVVAARRARRTA